MFKRWIKLGSVCLIGFLAAFQAHAQMSAYIPHAITLAPAGSQVYLIREGHPYAEMIDQQTYRILATPTGRTLCGAVNSQYDQFLRAFFISEQMAKKGYELCKGHFGQGKMVNFKKYFYVVLIPEGVDYVADGWTTPRNETFLFFSQKEFTPERLTRTLIHEYAVSLDRKETVGFGGMLKVSQLGLVEDAQSCTAMTIIRSSPLKQTLSALRAFDMEQRIARELRIPLSDGFNNWEGKVCLDKLLFMAPYVDKIGKLSSTISVENNFNSLFDVPRCVPLRLPPESFEEKAELLTQLELTFEDGSRRNACEYLTEGWPFLPGASFRGGPGPRVGGGGGW